MLVTALLARPRLTFEPTDLDDRPGPHVSHELLVETLEVVRKVSGQERDGMELLAEWRHPAGRLIDVDIAQQLGAGLHAVAEFLGQRLEIHRLEQHKS